MSRSCAQWRQYRFTVTPLNEVLGSMLMNECTFLPKLTPFPPSSSSAGESFLDSEYTAFSRHAGYIDRWLK